MQNRNNVTIKDAGKQAWDWLEELSMFSETDAGAGQGVTRLYATTEHAKASDFLKQAMIDAGMKVHMDNTGSVIGRYESPNPDAKIFIMGSHQDSVPNGGKYDGAMGVILPMALVHYLHQNNIELPFHLDVIGFGDEEGVRFQSSMLGSTAICGLPVDNLLQAKDKHGVSVRDALIEFGCNPDDIKNDAYDKDDVIGFLETHIEQGPQLEKHDVPVGVVTAITGLERHTLSVMGKAGHAGTVPMNARQDALVGAAHVITMLDDLLKTDDELVGVVGEITNYPNGVNVIPQQTDITIEIRSPNDAKRIAIREQLLSKIDAKLRELNLDYKHSHVYEQSAVDCSEILTQSLVDAIESTGSTPLKLFSGAGHDAMVVSKLTDVAMMFVRCKDGLSHHPDESITQDDLLSALTVLIAFCEQLTENK